MTNTQSFLRRDVTGVQPWTETCGQIRPVLEEKDGAAAEVHHLEITNAKLHYHERTDEIYYVLIGKGIMTIDGKSFDVVPGAAVLTRPGSSHGLKQTGTEDLVIMINYEQKVQ